MSSYRSIPLLLHLFMLIFVPGVNRGGYTFHAEDFFLLACVGVCFAQEANRRAFFKRMSDVPVFFLCLLYTGFAVWCNFVNMFLATEQEAAALPMFRSVAFLIWLLCLVDLKQKLWDAVRALVFFGLAQDFIVYSQANNLFAINEWLTPLYATTIENNIYSLLGLRSDGTYANPNDAGIAIAIFSAAALACWLRAKTVWPSFFSALAAVVGLYSVVVFCKSRTGTAVVGAAFLAYAFIALKEKKGQTIRLASMGVIFVIALAGGITQEAFSDTKLQDRFAVFTGGERLTTEGSFAERLNMWSDGYALIAGDLLTGLGFNALVTYGWLDGGYITYLFISGVIGCIMLFCAHVALVVGPPPSRSLELYAMLALFALITVSHPLIMRDKLWLPGLVIALFLRLDAKTAIEETESEEYRDNGLSQKPLHDPLPAKAAHAAE